MDVFASDDMEAAARPLLQLARHITRLESTFVCESQSGSAGQKVRFSANEGGLQVAEGSVEDWQDSHRRSMMGIRAFYSLPMRIDEATVGMLCAAGQAPCELSPRRLEGMRLIAEAFQHLLLIDQNLALAEARAEVAEQALEEAREEALRHAADSLQMQRLAHTDALTGLPNRRGFMTRWEDQLSRSARRNTPLALLLIDADHFKQVNDTMGHAMGDAVLRAISASLLVARRTPDIVARLGGDEFALATANTDPDHLKALAEDIRRTFAVVAEELGVDTTLSIGIVSSLDCPRETMLADADSALYRSKAAGGDAVRTHECGQH